ncbi:MAG TPA: hypothetical protein VIK53_04055 [Verrucomicrobiae bacterium]
MKKKQWGGARKGAGRPEGKTKEKICVSVNRANWQTAISRWNDKQSRLVDWLVLRYIDGNTASIEARAA